MAFQGRIVTAIAVGAAVGSILLTAAVFLLLRRYETLVAADKEAAMAPIVREKIDYFFHRRQNWLSDFDESDLLTNGNGDPDEFTKVYVQHYLGCWDALNFNYRVGIDPDSPPLIDPATVNGNDPAPHDIQAAISHYFDDQLDLGIDPKIIERMLLSRHRNTRDNAIEFLVNKAALCFSNFGSSPKYTLLPPKILELAKEIDVRGFEALNNFEDRGYQHDERDNHFPVLINRWRTLTFKLYGVTNMPPEVHKSMELRIEFLLTILKPVIKTEKLVDAREMLHQKIKYSLDLALYSALQMGLKIHSWDFVGPRSKVVYVGEPDRIERFDMMAEKAIVLQPAWLQSNHSFHGLPFVNSYVWEKAIVKRYTEKEWAQFLTD